MEQQELESLSVGSASDTKSDCNFGKLYRNSPTETIQAHEQTAIEVCPACCDDDKTMEMEARFC